MNFKNLLYKFTKIKYRLNSIVYKIFRENFDLKINYDFEKFPKRWEIINLLIRELNMSKYLEIVVYKLENFSKIICEKKIGIDPKSSGHNIMQLTSDKFFKNNKEKFDLVFIDGLHQFNQVKRDIFNSLNILNNRGLLLIHDCLPDRCRSQMVPRSHEKWNGDVWKVIVDFRTHNSLFVGTIIADEGIALIFKIEDYQKVSLKLNYKKLDLTNFNKSNFKKLNFKDYYYNYNSYLNTITYNNFIDLLRIIKS